MTTLAEFEAMVNNHDLTYDYSDDGHVWRNGQAQRDKIRQAAKTLPIEDVTRIWNAKCDRTLVPECAPQFYWRP